MKKGARLFLKRNSPSILVGIGVVGFWTMGALIFKHSSVIKEKLEEKRADKSVENDIPYEETKLSVVDTVKTVLPIMWPTLLIGGVSTYCIITANKVNIKRNAAMASAYYISQNALHEYQEKVIEHLGERKNQKIKDEIAQHRLETDSINNKQAIVTGNGDHLCYDMVFGNYFYSNIEKVKQAVLNIDEKLLNEMYMTVNDFRYELGLPPVDVGNDLGWKIENGQMSVEFSSQLAANGQPCLVIRYEVCPV